MLIRPASFGEGDPITEVKVKTGSGTSRLQWSSSSHSTSIIF